MFQRVGRVDKCFSGRLQLGWKLRETVMIKGRGNQIVGREMVVKTLRVRKDLFGKRCKGAHFDQRRAQSVAEQAAEGNSSEEWPGTKNALDLTRYLFLFRRAFNNHITPYTFGDRGDKAGCIGLAFTREGLGCGWRLEGGL